MLLLALSACVGPSSIPVDVVEEPPAVAMSAPVGDIPIPKGSPIVRMECFADFADEDRVSSSSSARPSSPPPATSSRPPASAPKAPRGGAGGSNAPSAEATADYGDADGMAPPVMAKPPPPPPTDPGSRKSAEPEPREEMPDSPQRDAASLEWGATVYLSNDDSMSLASAQRVLWAVKNDASISPRQVRPHELLNYFSFDTDPVPTGHMFSVKASAEKTASETMTVALAVHGSNPPRKPIDLTMVVDRSGSMSAEGRMEYLKKGLHLMKQSLVRGDRVDIVMFDDQVCSPLENFVVGRDDAAVLDRVIDAMQPRGSTDIGIGLKEGYRIATGADRQVGVTRSHRVMLITDALVNTGDIDPNTLSEIGKGFDEKQIRLTGVGVGRDINDEVLDRLTEKGKGAYVFLGSEAVVERVFGAQGFDSLVQTIAHDVKFSIDLPDSMAMERFYGEEASTNAADVQPINYYAGTTQLFLQDLRVDPSKLKPSDPVVLTIAYREASTGEPSKQVFRTTVGEMMGNDKHNLDKARALMSWTDMVQARSMGADPCGQPAQDYRTRAAKVSDDAEIAYVTTLAKKWCTVDLPVETPASQRVSYKVKVDSDVPIAEVVLFCGGTELKQKLSGSDTVARFEGAPAGTCTVTLEGNVPMQASVQVPATGGDLKCTVRGGRMSCG